jgi:ankyrin repeat protein
MYVENLSPPSSPATSTKQEQNRIEMSNFLFHAVLGNDILLIRKILANEIYDINHFEKVCLTILQNHRKSQGSRTVLQEACRKGNIEVVKLLIESNADPNISAGVRFS